MSDADRWNKREPGSADQAGGLARSEGTDTTAQDNKDGSRVAALLMSWAAALLMPWLVGAIVFFWVFAAIDTFAEIPHTVRQVLYGVFIAPWALLFISLVPYSVVNGITWFRNAPPADTRETVRTIVGVVLTLIAVAMILSGIFDPAIDRIVSFFAALRTSVFG